MSDTLLPDNQAYYEKLAEYIGGALFTRADATSDTLAEIKADLLTAQADGQSAADYFGAEPEVIAKQIVANLPRQPLRDTLLMALVGYGAGLFVIVWANLYHGGLRQPLGSQAVLAGVVLVLISIVLDLDRRRAFKKRWQRYLMLVGIGILFGLGFAAYDLVPKFGVVTYPVWLVVALSALSCIAALWLGVWLGTEAPWVMSVLGGLAVMYLGNVGVRQFIAAPNWQLNLALALGAFVVVRLGALVARRRQV